MAKSINFQTLTDDQLKQYVQSLKKATLEDFSLESGIKLLKQNKQDNLDHDFIEKLLSNKDTVYGENIESLKLPALAMLIEHLKTEHKLDTSNCFIAFDSKRNSFEKLQEAVKFAANRDQDTYIIHKSCSGHDVLLTCKVLNDNKYFVLLDSTGSHGKSYFPIQ